MTVTIEIKGLDELNKKLQRLSGQPPVWQPAIQAAAEHVKGKIATYPAATSANAPGQRRWYERGFGPRWMRKDGSVGGRKTSQMLGRKWTIKVDSGRPRAVVGNNVTYAPYVQDADEQAGFHKARGWQTIQDVARQEAETVAKFISDAIRKVLR